MANLTKPNKIVYIDGSIDEKKRLEEEAVNNSELIKLNEEEYPNCFYHRTNQNDVARVEELTFICTKEKSEVGPNNNWMESSEAYKKLGVLFEGSMTGRTMYVIPYLLGPKNSKFTKIGIEITDSIYVVLNMRIMTKIGIDALNELGESDNFVKGLHSKGELDPKKRYICHFPEDNTIWSIGSGYGGNVLLSKKCFALRIASYQGKKEGWLAEHMLILGVENPKGETHYIAAAFPSACGKTNLAMIIPPKIFRDKGYKVWTVGDDIAWMRVGEDGRLWAVNPEYGFFGVAPGTSRSSNLNAFLTIKKDSIFTNTVLTENGKVWWEGMGEKFDKPAHDWKGNPWGENSSEKGAHPNSRFTAPIEGCPSISKEWSNPNGVPISAIVFGGRREKVAPLVYESFNFSHGVFVGSIMASETTAAANGKVGVTRRDPMAMLPFCGYDMGEYFNHWLEVGKKLKNPPKIFNVNWFRKNKNNKFLWPGFSENFRVIKWIIDRANNEVFGNETEIGYIPYVKDINLEGLGVDKNNEVIIDTPNENSKDVQKYVEELLKIDREAWREDIVGQELFFDRFETIPSEILNHHKELKKKMNEVCILN